MESKTSGAWIIHHALKLTQVANPFAFDHIALAGKAGLLLSALCASHQESTIGVQSLQAIARANGISPTIELPTLLTQLQDARLIDIASSGEVHALGLTTASVLTHTHDIFVSADPSAEEFAALTLAEGVSERPQPRSLAAEQMGDTYALSRADVVALLDQVEAIGFVDYEDLGQTRKLYFNGSLFRREDAKKAEAILSSLSAADIRKVGDIQQRLRDTVCVPLSEAITVLGQDLFKKLQAIGMFDVNTVSNERERVAFITKPSAFQKYGNATVEDALDLVKMFVTSLTYGMTHSAYGRGRITMLPQLMQKLIRGEWVGPATAIGQDYKALELRRVIRVRQEANGLFSMLLLKRDVGELALQVLEQGDISETSLSILHGASITGYTAPERNREIVRRRQIKRGRREVVDMLRTLRSEKT